MIVVIAANGVARTIVAVAVIVAVIANVGEAWRVIEITRRVIPTVGAVEPVRAGVPTMIITHMAIIMAVTVPTVHMTTVRVAVIIIVITV